MPKVQPIKSYSTASPRADTLILRSNKFVLFSFCSKTTLANPLFTFISLGKLIETGAVPIDTGNVISE